MKLFAIFLLFFVIPLFADEKVRAAYAAISPKSAAQNFAFYELYPNTLEGKKALRRAWKTLTNREEEDIEKDPFPKFSVANLIKAINREESPCVLFSAEELTFLEGLGAHLKNRNLLGRNSTSPLQIRALAEEEIDLARAIFLEEYQDIKIVRSYEIFIDLIALQVLSRLPDNASAQEIIFAINTLIFYEMGFSFPSTSSWQEKIDTYTALPSVIDAKKGVCLGVSILYLAIAQRIGLPLEAITPPGHIYVRFAPEKEDPINIETTARGIHLPSEHYQGLDLEELPKRSLKEVVGLTFLNKASVYFQKKAYEKALACYEKALPYLPEDPLLMDLMGYNHLFLGAIEKGETLLAKASCLRREKKLPLNVISEDYLKGEVSTGAMKMLFSSTHDTKEAILEKRALLKKELCLFPKFRAGLLAYAQTYLNLGEEKRAIAPLEELQKIHPKHITASYHLAMIYLKRYDYNKSWFYFTALKSALADRKKPPKMLKNLESSLRRLSPKPIYGSS